MPKLRIHNDEELFSRLQLFWGVTLESVIGHLDRCLEIDLSAGSVLIAPPKRNEDVYIVQSGELNIYLESLESAPIATISVGETVGEMSIVDRSNPSAFVVASEDTHLLVISQKVLWDMVSASHGVARNLLLILSTRLRSGNEVLIQNKEMIRQLEEVAYIDALTGINNRRWLDINFDKVLHRCQRSKSPFTVILVDVDHFKKYNDTQGHLAGDDALRAVASAMRNGLRPNDMYARYGGEEFIFLLPNIGTDEGEVVAERVRADVEKTVIVSKEGKTLPSVTVSLGIAELKPGVDTMGKLVEAADQALYRAKGSGRNCFSL